MSDKSKYYTSAQHYKDLDGNMKSFTFIDHDIKTKIGTSKMEKEEIEILNDSVKTAKELAIKAILSLPAVSVIRNSQGLYEEFIERNVDKGIIWREDMVTQTLDINDILRYNMFQQCWKATVKMDHWNTDMSYEDIIEGKWKTLV